METCVFDFIRQSDQFDRADVGQLFSSLDERDERSRPVSFTSLSSTSAASSGPFCKIIFNNVPCEHSIFAYSYP